MLAQGSNKSELFTRYNKARAGATDKGRVNRALGVAQSKAARPYTTTADSCTCKDWKFRGSKTGQPCKHMTALALATPAVEVAPAVSRSVADINNDLF